MPVGKFSDIPINGRHGIWISYYENGNQQVQIDYKNGSKHGKFYEFYENLINLLNYIIISLILSFIIKIYYTF